MTGDPVGRRRALGLLAAGSASVVAGVTGWVTGLGAPASGGYAVTGDQPLREPLASTSNNGALAVSLTAAPGAAVAGQAGAGLGFNGGSPGPTLRVRPGDVLRVRLINHLQQPTNLHTHGLHVSPERNGDNPFVVIAPGEVFDYEYTIPANHPAGTFWYHPHHHQYVADQLFGGLAGALIVDSGPDLGAATDRVLLIGDTTLDDGGRIAAVSAMDRMMGRQGSLVLVNGQHQPVATAESGVPERWRLINACTSRVLSLRLEGHQLTHVARDGYFLPVPEVRDRIVLAPGNRADVLVHPAAGRHRLLTDPYDRGNPGMMGGMAATGSTAANGPIALATLVVTGAMSPTASPPGALPAPALPTGPVTTRRTVTFGMQMGMGGGGMGFTIDGRRFDPQRTDQAVRLGDTEEWLVSNTSPMDSPVPPARVALPGTGHQRKPGSRGKPAGRGARAGARLGAPPGDLRRLLRPQRLPLPHPRPRRPGHDGGARSAMN